MWGTLYDRPETGVVFRGRRIRLRTGFRQVLRYYAVLGEDALSEMDKIELGLWLFVKNRLRVRLMSPARKVQLMEEIFRQHIGEGGASDAPRSIDFDQDRRYIYAAFWQCYRLDLLGRDRDLHWQKFLSLFGALPDETRLMQIVSIRTRPMPKATKYNAQERARLARLKAQYRLRLTEEERKRNLTDGFMKIAQMLEARAACKR